MAGAVSREALQEPQAVAIKTTKSSLLQARGKHATQQVLAQTGRGHPSESSCHCRRSASSRSERMRPIAAAIEAGSRRRRRPCSGARLGRGGVRLDGSWLTARDPVDPAAVGLLGGQLEPELLAHHAGKEPPHECACQPVDSMMVAIVAPFGRRSSPSNPRLLVSRAPRDAEQRSCDCQPWTGFSRPALLDRARLLLGMSKFLSLVSAQQRSAPPKPRGGPMALAGREEQPVRLRVRDHHACSVYERSRVQNGRYEQIYFFTQLRISSAMTIPDANSILVSCPLFRAKDPLC